MTTLLRAPAGGGKTAEVLARLRRLRAAEPLAPVSVILPNQFQRAAFSRRLSAQGGALGVARLTFEDLAQELLARAAGPRLLPRLEKAAQLRVLRQCVDQLAASGALAYFDPIRDRPGLAVALREVIGELKRSRLLPEQFAAAAQGLGPRLEEIGALYAAYQAWLHTHGWADIEGQSWLAAEALVEAPELGRDLRLLIVDGFDEFNPTQLAVLALLAGRAQETLITLTGEPAAGTKRGRPASAGPRLALRRFQRAEAQLRRFIAPLEVVDLPAPARPAPVLARLEPRLFNAGAAPAHAAGRAPAVTFTAAQDRDLEARAALRWVKERLVLDGWAPTDLAVMARSLEPYRAPLLSAAREFGLPLHLTAGQPLAENPLVDAVLGLLALPAPPVDWRPRAVLAALRSPYFDWAALGITAEATAALEMAAVQGVVVNGLAQWRAALHQLGAAADTPPLDEPEAARLAPAAARGAAAAFERLAARLEPPAAGTDLAGWLSFVEGLLGGDEPPDGRGPDQPALNVAARLGAAPEAGLVERDRQALRAFKEALRGLALAESVLAAPRAWEYPAFLVAVREAVEAEVYHPPAPAEAVLAASVLDARGLAFRGAALLGLAEGEFPLAERELPLLREAERAALRARGLAGLEPRLRGEEVTLFYEAVTRAGEQLWLSRPYLADDGQPWEPSAYWRQVQRLLGEPPEARLRAEDRLPPAQTASIAEWIAHGYAPETVAPGLAVLRAREAAAAAGPYEGELSELSAALAGRYG
ncbi:MAG: hypothetical protein JNK29_14845, partial [Anaerolineales bacterium]|nr:hypothetical protein [Anaerolineales bacterium]